MGMRIELTRPVLERLIEAAAEALPQESCGLLTGRAGRIEGVVPTRNVHPEPATHFEIDPQALVDAHRAARNGGPQVLGYYHSHPAGPAAPSAADRREAAGDGSVWAIVAGSDVALWRDDEDGFVALSYIVTER